jgi:O-acetyl-ADP-ribose deacetylase (regulator of RNase III)
MTLAPVMYNQAMTSVREHLTSQGQQLHLIHGDITHSSVDAIINAANRQLQHGGGVAGAIARAGGQIIQTESNEWVRSHGPLTYDTPALTSAGDLPSRYVIHTVGPVWGEGDEDRKLRTAVQSALHLADEKGFKSVAMPAISTGIFGFPKDRGARVILDAIIDYLDNTVDTSLSRVEVTLIDEPSVKIFATEFDTRWGDA